MALSNAERQRRFRQRRKAELIAIANELARQLEAIKPGIPPEAWDALAKMSGADLRCWARVGQRMASSRHDDPVTNALRWVQERLCQLWAEALHDYIATVDRGEQDMNLIPAHLVASQQDRADGYTQEDESMANLAEDLKEYGRDYQEQNGFGPELTELMVHGGLANDKTEALRLRGELRRLADALSAAGWKKKQARRVMREDDLSIGELLRQAILAYRFRTNLELNALDLVKSGGSERTELRVTAHSPPSQISKMVLSTLYVGGAMVSGHR